MFVAIRSQCECTRVAFDSSLEVITLVKMFESFRVSGPYISKTEIFKKALLRIGLFNKNPGF